MAMTIVATMMAMLAFLATGNALKPPTHSPNLETVHKLIGIHVRIVPWPFSLAVMLGPASKQRVTTGFGTFREKSMEILQQGGGSRPGNSGEFV